MAPHCNNCDGTRLLFLWLGTGFEKPISWFNSQWIWTTEISNESKFNYLKTFQLCFWISTSVWVGGSEGDLYPSKSQIFLFGVWFWYLKHIIPICSPIIIKKKKIGYGCLLPAPLLTSKKSYSSFARPFWCNFETQHFHMLNNKKKSD